MTYTVFVCLLKQILTNDDDLASSTNITKGLFSKEIGQMPREAKNVSYPYVRGSSSVEGGCYPYSELINTWHTSSPLSGGKIAQ